MSTQTHRPRTALAVALVLATGLALAACGGSSSSSSSTASASKAASLSGTEGRHAQGASGAPGVPPGAPGGPGGPGFRGGPTGASGAFGRFSAGASGLRECLKKNGVVLPTFTPGQGPTGATGTTGHHFFRFGAGAGAITERAKLSAALQKCGSGRAGFFRGGTQPGGFRSNPAYQAGLTKFAACMREHGVNLAAPNTSGTGPVFSTKGINRQSSTFMQADSKCRPLLSGIYRPGAVGQPAK
jgi:hypothetical protein